MNSIASEVLYIILGFCKRESWAPMKRCCKVFREIGDDIWKSSSEDIHKNTMENKMEHLTYVIKFYNGGIDRTVYSAIRHCVYEMHIDMLKTILGSPTIIASIKTPYVASLNWGCLWWKIISSGYHSVRYGFGDYHHEMMIGLLLKSGISIEGDNEQGLNKVYEQLAREGTMAVFKKFLSHGSSNNVMKRDAQKLLELAYKNNALVPVIVLIRDGRANPFIHSDSFGENLYENAENRELTHYVSVFEEHHTFVGEKSICFHDDSAPRKKRKM
jgi:hypothetical protein